MTAKELIKVLKQIKPDTRIVLSSDPEGNKYSLVDECQAVNFDAVHCEICDDADEGTELAVCLWPRH